MLRLFIVLFSYERGIGGVWEVRDKSIFVKMIFRFNKSHAKLPLQLKMHVGSAMSTMLIYEFR